MSANKNNKPKNFRNIKLTKHFIQRYYERVFGQNMPEKLSFKALNKIVFSHLMKTLNDRQKDILEQFASCKNVRIPCEYYQIVISKRKLITIY